MGNLVLTLYKDPAKNEDRVYLIPKNVTDIIQVSEIIYSQENSQSKVTLAFNLPKNKVALRKNVVDRYYGGIETLVEKVKSGEIKYSDSRRRFENAN